MDQPNLLLLCGIPASGKSTRAAEMAKDGWVVVCPDTIRKELTGDESDQSENESVFIRARFLTRTALRAGQSVVLDATNVRAEYRIEWQTIAHLENAIYAELWMGTPLWQCFWRNWRRQRRVPLRVMFSMAWHFIRERP